MIHENPEQYSIITIYILQEHIFVFASGLYQLPHPSQLPHHNLTIIRCLNTMQRHSTLPTILTLSCSIHIPCTHCPHFMAIYIPQHKLPSTTHILRQMLHRRIRISLHHQRWVLKMWAICRRYLLSMMKLIFSQKIFFINLCQLIPNVMNCTEKLCWKNGFVECSTNTWNKGRSDT